MQTLLQDLRYGMRMLLKSPGYTAIAVLTLALGIGANSAIFSVVNGVLLRPLPYQQPDLLFRVHPVNSKTGRSGTLTSPLNFLDWRSRNQSFEFLAGFQDNVSFNLSTGSEPERITAMMVSDTFLPTLGARPLLGRNFLPEEDRKGGADVVILSHQLWTRRFGADPNRVGRTITLSSRPYTVVGVMPPEFSFPGTEATAWVPFGFVYEDGGRGNFFVEVIGKLKPGVTQAQAQAEMVSIAAVLEQQYPQINTDVSIGLTPLHEQVTGKIRPLLLTLLGAVGFVLLIACANVANLLLARAAGRQKEIAIRSALGASRLRIVCQLLSESLLLALFGGLLGLLVAYWSVQALIAFNPADIPRLGEISLDKRVLGFTFALAVLTGLLFGLAPALQASRTNLNETLKESGRSASSSSSLLRSSLVVIEIALSLVLLVGAGLLVRSFWQVLSAQPGFRTEQLLTFDVGLPWQKYDRDKTQIFFQSALERISTLPGVQMVGTTTALPLSQANNMRFFAVEGRAGNSPRDFTIEHHRFVSPRYFETLGIPLQRGRQFNDADNDTAVSVVIINEAFAQRHFPNQDALGKRIKMGQTAESPYLWMTVVGIVGDVRHTSLEARVRPEMYRPFRQLTSRENERKLTFAIRTTQPPESLLATIQKAIQSLDPEQPLANAATMERLFDRSLAGRRFSLWLLGIFAAVALTLAVIGIYGVMSYAVSQSTREIGIRLALGAQQRDVLQLVLGQGMALTIVGVVLGVAGAFALTRLMKTLLYEVTATDPITFIAVSMLLVFAAALACYLPARRAMKTDPMIALRCE